MEIIRNIVDDIIYVGASDKRLGLFENLFPIPSGVSYNSYLINDEHTCLMDTCDVSVGKQFIENLKAALNGRSLDYLVVNHMEPDHAALISDVLMLYPNAMLILNQMTLKFLNQAIDEKFSYIIVKENDFLDLGKHKLTFIMTPMVHWPEVMMSYDSYSKVLFSADAFGTFGALDGNIFADELKLDDTFYSEARRYYTNIVGKYGSNVLNVLNKAKALDIEYICALHGPIWHNNFNELLNLYALWASYKEEVKGVMICYASMYGNTANAAYFLANELAKNGVKSIKVYDVSQTDVSYLISDTFKYSNIVLMAPNYNANIYPKMEAYLMDMAHLNVSNKHFSIIENGTWAPVISKKITDYVIALNNTKLVGEPIKIKTSGNAETKLKLNELAATITKDLKND